LRAINIKRLPIVRDGKLIGIVSRADVVRAIARTPDEIAEAL
jgi:CBS domain-containing protein